MISSMDAAIYFILCAGALAWSIVGKDDRYYTDFIAGYIAFVGFFVTGAYYEANIVYTVVGGVVTYVASYSTAWILYAAGTASFCIMLIKLYTLATDLISEGDSARESGEQRIDESARTYAGLNVNQAIVVIFLTVTVMLSSVLVGYIFQSITLESASATISSQIQIYKVVHAGSTVITSVLTIVTASVALLTMRRAILGKQKSSRRYPTMNRFDD